MRAYKYKALSDSGQKVSGVVEAYDEFEAVARIKQTCNIILDIDEVKESKKDAININEPMWVSEKVLSLTANQFAILLKAGLPMARTVEIISQQTTDALMKRYLQAVAEDVAAGYSLAQSLELRGKKIPVGFIETVRAGESSGTLESAFEKLTRYYEKSYKLRGKVKSAMTYPLLLVALSIIVIIVVVKVAVPTIANIIEETGGELPGPTRLLLGIYNFFGKYGLFFIIGLALLIIAYVVWSKTEKGRMTMAKIQLKLPVLGELNIMNAASEFAGNMMTLLSAGLPVSQALTITSRVLSNYAVGSSLNKAVFGVEEGRRLGDVLKVNEYLPPLLTEMTAVGEESGSLEETLDTIGSYYDSEVEEKSAKALSLLEPIMTMVLGVVVGFIVIALYLPMFTMYNGM